ncbi:MAG: succinate dehydrogenase assembly factor 2 [Gammaproteobacteria bacterium]
MNNRSRLLWRCRRGTKEMDFLFQTFLEQEYDSLATEQQVLFEQFLEETDPDIYSWITGTNSPDNHSYLPLIQRLQNIRGSMFGNS